MFFQFSYDCKCAVFQIKEHGYLSDVRIRFATTLQAKIA